MQVIVKYAAPVGGQRIPTTARLEVSEYDGEVILPEGADDFEVVSQVVAPPPGFRRNIDYDFTEIALRGGGRAAVVVARWYARKYPEHANQFDFAAELANLAASDTYAVLATKLRTIAGENPDWEWSPRITISNSIPGRRPASIGSSFMVDGKGYNIHLWDSEMLVQPMGAPRDAPFPHPVRVETLPELQAFVAA